MLGGQGAAVGTQRKKRHAGGRPPKYSEGQWAAVCRDIARGMPVRYACLRAGTTFAAYEKKHQREPEFVRAVELAKADFLDLALNVIQSDMPGHVGMKWTLDRRHAADFHKPAEVQLNVQTDVHNTGLMVTPELQAELAQIARQHFTKAGGRN